MRKGEIESVRTDPQAETAAAAAAAAGSSSVEDPLQLRHLGRVELRLLGGHATKVVDQVAESARLVVDAVVNLFLGEEGGEDEIPVPKGNDLVGERAGVGRRRTKEIR